MGRRDTGAGEVEMALSLGRLTERMRGHRPPRRELKPVWRWCFVGVMAILLVEFAVIGFYGDYRDLALLALSAVAALFSAACVLSRWTRSEKRAGALLPLFRTCPAWFGRLVFGLAGVTLVCSGYLVVRHVYLDGPSAEVERLAPLLVFGVGCVCLLYLLPGLLIGRWDGE